MVGLKQVMVRKAYISAGLAHYYIFRSLHKSQNQRTAVVHNGWVNEPVNLGAGLTGLKSAVLLGEFGVLGVSNRKY